MDWFRRNMVWFLLAKVVIYATATAGGMWLLHEKIKALEEWRLKHPCEQFTPGGWCIRKGIYQ
jgi:hypothetical protein